MGKYRSVEMLVTLTAASPTVGRATSCLINELVSRLGGRVEISDGDVAAFYEGHGGTTIENREGGGWILQTVSGEEIDRLHKQEQDDLEDMLADSMDRIMEEHRNAKDSI